MVVLAAGAQSSAYRVHTVRISRRAAIISTAAAAAAPAALALARTPGSSDVSEAIEQIRDARAALRGLQKGWSTYACIDGEGRACNIDSARKILGGVAPQRGDAAIAVAKETPLYRIDGAIAAVRNFALNAPEGSWGTALDIERFVDKGDEITFALKKADDSFYGAGPCSNPVPESNPLPLSTRGPPPLIRAYT